VDARTRTFVHWTVLHTAISSDDHYRHHSFPREPHYLDLSPLAYITCLHRTFSLILHCIRTPNSHCLRLYFAYFSPFHFQPLPLQVRLVRPHYLNLHQNSNLVFTPQKLLFRRKRLENRGSCGVGRSAGSTHFPNPSALPFHPSPTFPPSKLYCLAAWLSGKGVGL